MLRHDREGEIVPVAAFVTNLVVVRAGGESRAVGQLAKVPVLGLAERLVMAVKMVPMGSLLFPERL